jgi:hypothetical protein
MDFLASLTLDWIYNNIWVRLANRYQLINEQINLLDKTHKQMCLTC